MLMILTLLTAFAWLWLVFFHGRFWHVMLPTPPRTTPELWPDVAIIVPARDEAAMLPRTLPGLLTQDYPGRYCVILVDDQSSDGTADIARSAAAMLPNTPDLLHIVSPASLPAGWSGKVHAMDCGVATAGQADFFLFTDADILHPPGSLRFLVNRALEDRLDLHSFMVRLRCQTFWEKLLIPAFVYFFQMLYPFTWCNDPLMKPAAAAGGAMLVRRTALEAAGGLSAIKGALIDDCSLARAIKHRPSAEKPRLLLTLVEDVVSLRPYETLSSLWHMIRRAAFTQLNYSAPVLAGAVVGLFCLFVLPLLLPFCGGIYALLGWLMLVAMIYSYLPLVEFYRINILWSATLPLAALLYCGATIDSARLYWSGRGGAWKGRAQAGQA